MHPHLITSSWTLSISSAKTFPLSRTSHLAPTDTSIWKNAVWLCTQKERGCGECPLVSVLRARSKHWSRQWRDSSNGWRNRATEIMSVSQRSWRPEEEQSNSHKSGRQVKVSAITLTHSGSECHGLEGDGNFWVSKENHLEILPREESYLGERGFEQASCEHQIHRAFLESSIYYL